MTNDQQGGEYTGTPTSPGNLNKPFWVRITEEDVSQEFYGWEEVYATSTGFQLLDGGRTGTTTLNPVYEANGAVLAVDSYSLVMRSYLDVDDSLDWVYVSVNNATASVGGTINMWCNNTVAASVVTVEAQVGIAAVSRLAAGKYLVIFTTNFFDKECFEWAGSTNEDDVFLWEFDRTPNSVTVQTSSGADADRWGIDARGKLCYPFEGPFWYCMEPPSGSGSGGGSTGDCACDPLPSNLTLVFTTATNCDCLIGATCVLADVGGGVRQGVIPANQTCRNLAITATVTCTADNYYLQLTDGANGSYTGTSVISCDPVHLQVTVGNPDAVPLCGLAGASFTVDITE